MVLFYAKHRILFYFRLRFLKETDIDYIRSKHKKNLLTLTKDEKKEIKRKKIDARIQKLDRREKLLERERLKVNERKGQLISEVMSDSEEEFKEEEVI